MEEKHEFVYLEDGRRAEKVVQAEGTNTGEVKVTTEVWAEPKFEKKLTQRISEYTKPVITRREIEYVDEVTGEVVEKKVESIEPNVKMELREHIATESGSVSALNAKDDCDCYVTQEEMQKTFTEGLLMVAKALSHREEEPVGKVAALQAVVAEKMENTKLTASGMATWGSVTAVLGAILVYIVFIM